VRDSLLTVVGAGAVLTVAGFIATAGFEAKLGLGIGSSASIGLPLIGGKALFAIALHLLVVCLGFAIVGLVFGLVTWGLRRAGRGSGWLARVEGRVRNRWLSLRDLPTDRLAAAVALLSVVCLVVVGAVFWRLLATLWGDESSALGCSHLWFHRAYYLVLSGAAGIFSAAAFMVHKLGARKGTPATWQGQVFGGITAVSVLLYLVLAILPWQLLFAAQRPRAILRPNVRAYIVSEDDRWLVVYVPDSARSLKFAVSDPLLRRQRSSGYLFEEPEAFSQKPCR